MGITWQERLLSPLGRGSEWINEWMNERVNVCKWRDLKNRKKEDQWRTADSEEFRSGFAAADKFLTGLWQQSQGLSPAYHLLITVTVSFNSLSTLTERQNYLRNTCPSLQPVKAELVVFDQSETSRFSGVPTKPPNDSNGFVLYIQLYFVLVSYLWIITSISNYLYIWLTGSSKSK